VNTAVEATARGSTDIEPARAVSSRRGRGRAAAIGEGNEHSPWASDQSDGASEDWSDAEHSDDEEGVSVNLTRHRCKLTPGSYGIRQYTGCYRSQARTVGERPDFYQSVD